MDHDPITPKTYLQTYIALMALLALTVGVAYINLGPFNLLMSMIISVTKALLVVFFFMHMRYNPKIIWIYALLGVIWILTLISGTLADITTRI